MYYKVSPVIIVILIVMITAIGGFGVKILIEKNQARIEEERKVYNASILPELELTLDSEEENQEEVTITAVANTEEENGILSITLPDGSVNRSDTATYTVNKNGNYTFKAKGANGKTSSLTIEVNNVKEASASNPYIPKGFSYLEGDVETGYVIEDSYGNEFVWVPVESGKLTRNTMLDGDYEETNSTATALVNSVAKNYGFYIARYEASVYEAEGQKIAASMKNKKPWTNVNYSEASEACR